MTYVESFEEFVKNAKFGRRCKLEKNDFALMIIVYSEPYKLNNGEEFKGIYIIELLVQDLKDSDRWYIPTTTLVSYDDTIKIIESIMG